jgi:hypothetical protein
MAAAIIAAETSLRLVIQFLHVDSEKPIVLAPPGKWRRD